MKYKVTITTEDGKEHTKEGDALQPAQEKFLAPFKESQGNVDWEFFGWTLQPMLRRTLVNRTGFAPQPVSAFLPHYSASFLNRPGNGQPQVSTISPEVNTWPTKA